MKQSLFVLLVAFTIVILSSSNAAVRDKNWVGALRNPIRIDVVEKYQKALGFLQLGYKNMLLEGGAAGWNINISRECVDDIRVVVGGIREGESSSLEFIDAAGKPEAGILQGNLAWFGSFGQCQSIINVSSNRTSFSGKYCLTNIQQQNDGMDSSIGLRYGLCVPDSCSDVDVMQLLTNILSMLPPISNTEFLADSVVCQPKNLDYDTNAKVLLTVLSTLGFVLILATVYDVAIYQPSLIEVTRIKSIDSTPLTTEEDVHLLDSNANQSRSLIENDQHIIEDDRTNLLAAKPILAEQNNTARFNSWGRLLLVFSVYSNSKKILLVSNSDNSLSCIHGIRFLSMTWVILAHSYGNGYISMRDLLVENSIKGGFWIQPIPIASVSVDTFFVMSGLLLSYLFILNYESTKKLSVLHFYLHRYWRITAVYGVVMAVYTVLFRYFTTGPQWNPNGIPEWEGDDCKANWWTNFLYINNLVGYRSMCMGWTWYLANDMQFHWISPIILFPIVKWRKIGLASLGVLFVAHLSITAWVCQTNNIHFPSENGNGPDNGNFVAERDLYYNTYYIKPWNRVGPYLIGLLFGYLLAVYRKEKTLRIRPELVFIFWLVAAVCALAVVYGLYQVNNGTRELSLSVAVLYNVLHRNVWALSVSWVIFACVQGYGGFINTILSWSALVPLSRLTYCCYLIHYPLLFLYYSSRTTTINFSHLQVIFIFFGTLTVTYGFAFLFTVGCEAPLLGMEKIFARKSSKSKEG